MKNEILDFNKKAKTILIVVMIAFFAVVAFININYITEGPINSLEAVMEALIWFVLGYIGIKNYKLLGKSTPLSKVALSLGIAGICYGVGNAFWTYFGIVDLIPSINFTGITADDVPYPSIADVFYSIFGIFVIIPIFYMAKIYRKNKITALELFKIIAIIVIITTAFVIFVSKPEISAEPDLTQWSNLWTTFFNISYGITDALFIAGVVILLNLVGGRMYKGYILFIFSLIVLTISDIVFVYRASITETYYNGDIASILYGITVILLSLSVMSLSKSTTRNLENKF